MGSPATAGGHPFAELPRYLLRDRDAIFGHDFQEQVRDLRNSREGQQARGSPDEYVFNPM